MKDLVYSFDSLVPGEQSLAGGKGGTLARLFQAGYPVPDGFAILPGALAGDELAHEAWAEVQVHLRLIGSEANGTAVAVRSSALSEDSARASFAGEFETVLDVHTDEMIREAIHAERVQAYSQAKGLDTIHELAVVVQRLVRADVSGVLFTADPVSGSHMRMMGNFVYGLGEELVSGEAEPYTFTFERPRGKYDGPSKLKRFARKLYRLGTRLEKELGCPQDIEWAIADGNLHLLQSRPITTLLGYDPVTGEWNDSLTGDFLWSRNNFGEARPDVMTPLTFSMSEKVWDAVSILPGYSLAGNICGRYYANISASISMSRAMGKSPDSAREMMEGMLGNVPADLDSAGSPAALGDAVGHAQSDQAGPERTTGCEKGARVSGQESRAVPGLAPTHRVNTEQGGIARPVARRTEAPYL